jgi:thiosulfate/3-mercaptopyruvate sulfurtransferase
MKGLKFGSGPMVIFVMLLIAGIGCTNYQIPGNGSSGPVVNNCEICHTDYDRLVEVHTPDSAPPDTSYGVIPPYYEPYDRVFMGGTGYDSFKESGHYSVGCTGCHNGDAESEEKDLAHSGDFVSKPSLYYEDKCATCHQDIASTFTTSLHNGTGMKRVVALRSGLSGASDFDQLPQHQIDGYNQSCASCHGTCGNCHVVRPYMGGGGLSAGHNFNKTPDMSDVCITCHVSTKGHAFQGLDPDSEPDVHLAQESFTCLSCHNGLELHGDGQPVEQRYAYTELPECESCHSGLETANNFHSRHIADFDCQVCHSQDYNNCGSCHINGDGARIPAYMGFKIAANPLAGIKDYDFALVRRTLAAPDNWENYGVADYSNFDVLPTYNYATPHNLSRLTDRTNVGTASCSSNCHIRNDAGTLVNKELYLFQSDLLDWELDANIDITVDGKLPSYWMK